MFEGYLRLLALVVLERISCEARRDEWADFYPWTKNNEALRRKAFLAEGALSSKTNYARNFIELITDHYFLKFSEGESSNFTYHIITSHIFQNAKAIFALAFFQYCPAIRSVDLSRVTILLLFYKIKFIFEGCWYTRLCEKEMYLCYDRSLLLLFSL